MYMYISKIAIVFESCMHDLFDFIKKK